MESLLKFLLALVTFGACIFSSRTFGIGIWPLVLIAASAVLLLSLFLTKHLPWLQQLSRAVARLIGTAALLGFTLLMLASTVGGSASMSESNQLMAFFLLIIAILGCTFFVFKDKAS